MKEKWVVSAKKADFQAIGQHFSIDPVLARIMRNRGLTDLQEMNLYLHGTRADLNDPHLLKDADLAAQILREKIKEKKLFCFFLHSSFSYNIYFNCSRILHFIFYFFFYVSCYFI